MTSAFFSYSLYIGFYNKGTLPKILESNQDEKPKDWRLLPTTTPTAKLMKFQTHAFVMIRISLRGNVKDVSKPIHGQSPSPILGMQEKQFTCIAII